MRRAILTAVAAGALLVPAGAGADAGAVCTWGGTVDAATGTFAVSPGLTYTPATSDLDFFATGELAGDDERCTGTMTFDGFLWQGSGCRMFINEGDVSGVEGVATYHDAGAAVSGGFLFAPGRSTQPVAAFAPIVDDIPGAVGGCSSAEGFREGTFSSTVIWFE